MDEDTQLWNGLFLLFTTRGLDRLENISADEASVLATSAAKRANAMFAEMRRTRTLLT